MKIVTGFALIACAGVSLAGCVIVDADVDESDFRYSSDAERLYSADIMDDSISIRVAASGCTTKDFFEVDIDHRGKDKFSVEFERTRRDYCRMSQPNGEKLTYSFSELGLPAGAEIILENPVGR